MNKAVTCTTCGNMYTLGSTTAFLECPYCNGLLASSLETAEEFQLLSQLRHQTANGLGGLYG